MTLEQTMDLGRVGLWSPALHGLPSAVVRERAAQVEELGYETLWYPDALGRDPFVMGMLVLADTSTLTAATGIAGIHGRHPMTMRAGWESITEAADGRFVLGLGVSHAPLVEGFMHLGYERPLSTMRTYLDAMDAAAYVGASSEAPKHRMLAALGPKMLALAAERSEGALTYFVPVEHTPVARAALDAATSERTPTLAVEQAVVLATDPEEARRIARGHTSLYVGLPNYANNVRRLGYGDEDLEGAGSDRLVDAIVAWGDQDAIVERIRAHFDAGADHVCVQVLTDPQFRDSLDEWRTLAPALLSI